MYLCIKNSSSLGDVIIDYVSGCGQVNELGVDELKTPRKDSWNYYEKVDCN